VFGKVVNAGIIYNRFLLKVILSGKSKAIILAAQQKWHNELRYPASAYDFIPPEAGQERKTSLSGTVHFNRQKMFIFDWHQNLQNQ